MTCLETCTQVYSRRLPFRALLKDPWVVLEPQLRPDSVSSLVPLAGEYVNIT